MATITGNVKRITTIPAQTTMRITPRSVPVVTNGSLILPEQIIISTDSVGNFTVTLAMGAYEFAAGDAKVIVSSDATTNTYALEDRIISDVFQDPTLPVASPATDSSLGMVKIDSPNPNPVAVTGLFFVTDITALKAIAGHSSNKMAWIKNPPARAPREFIYDPTSSAAEDTQGWTVVRPNNISAGNPGRWLEW